MTTATRAAEPRTSLLRHNRQFRLLWVGQALSGFGSSMSQVALPLVLLAAGTPTATVAVVATAAAVAGLAVRIPAGLVSDHYDQRRLLIMCDLLRLLAVGAVALCLVVRPLPLWLAIGAVVVSAGAAEVFKPSQFQLIRRVVSAEQIPAAMSLSQARSYAAQMAGPAAAGLLIGGAAALPFAVDALTFLLSALCVAATAAGVRATGPAGTVRTAGAAGAVPAARRGGRAVRWGPAPGFLGRLTAGWRYLAHDRFLRRTTVFFSGLTVVFTMFGSVLLLGVGREPGGAVAVGWALSTAALAGLLGSLAAPYLQRRLPLAILVATGPAVAAAGLLVSWLTGSTLVLVAAFSAMCLLVPAINAAVIAVMATSIPQEIYGRVTTANDFTVQLLQPCAPLAAGLLLVSCSLSTTALVLAVCFAVLALGALTLPAPGPAAPAGPPKPARSDA